MMPGSSRSQQPGGPVEALIKMGDPYLDERSSIAVPLMAGGRSVEMINVTQRLALLSFGKVKVLKILAGMVAVALRMSPSVVNTKIRAEIPLCFENATEGFSHHR